jgi:membrane-bound ClpP family serine protease
MLLINVACVVLVIAGAVLFLYGANAYSSVIGWAGIGLFIGGFVVYFVSQGYKSMKKKE